MKKRKFRFIILTVVFLLIVAIAYVSFYQESRPATMKKIAVIVYGENVQRWENFQQGIMQAAVDLNAEVNFLTMTDDYSAANQGDLVEREVKNGAQGLVVAAVDSSSMGEVILAESKQVPIVMAETNVAVADGAKLQYVSADNREMGVELAEMIIKEHAVSTPIYLLEVSSQRDSVRERQEGLLSCLEEGGYQVTSWKAGVGQENVAQYVANQQRQFTAGIIVSLDDLSFESVIDSIEDKQHNEFSFYGIGSTAKIVYYLDQGVISGIVFQDEYQMGYMSMVRLFEQMPNRKSSTIENQGIEVHATNQETMHLPENERLLYPIIQ